ncbi:hypothetical protein WOLCODRAFT_163409 [Wolfiporia cocos MD-104 SS10]|uniref:Uncharacterized protein n=1 Tax=Wolfiporia cocos (strain MD-104) TaxID=742152 RepID=A0A2H3JST8_WOLCO|nr:hypothetical protein WOLCODRAFT_163409 [Wolfiporia cocos MD-104 SS10]
MCVTCPAHFQTCAQRTGLVDLRMRAGAGVAYVADRNGLCVGDVVSAPWRGSTDNDRDLAGVDQTATLLTGRLTQSVAPRLYSAMSHRRERTSGPRRLPSRRAGAGQRGDDGLRPALPDRMLTFVTCPDHITWGGRRVRGRPSWPVGMLHTVMLGVGIVLKRRGLSTDSSRVLVSSLPYIAIAGSSFDSPNMSATGVDPCVGLTASTPLTVLHIPSGSVLYRLPHACDAVLQHPTAALTNWLHYLRRDMLPRSPMPPTSSSALLVASSPSLSLVSVSP